jgi:hypothetical protein
MLTPHSTFCWTGRNALARCAAIGLLSCIALPANADWSITPRASFYFDNTIQRQSAFNYNTPEHQAGSDKLQADLASVNATSLAFGFPPTTLKIDPIDVSQRADQIAFPEFGATLTFGLGNSETTQVSLTALYGTTSAHAVRLSTESFHYSGFGTNVIDTDAQTARITTDVKRLDLEATVQHRLNETFSLVGGVRAERTSSDVSGSVTEVGSANFGNLFISNLNLYAVQQGFPAPFAPIYALDLGPGIVTESFSVWTYSIRVGAAAYAPVGEKHLFYVNGLLHFSRLVGPTAAFHYANGSTSPDPIPSETSLGPDISVGYMYRFSDRFGVDVRYRAQVYFPIAGPYKFDDARVNHGVGIGFTSWFGSR